LIKVGLYISTNSFLTIDLLLTILQLIDANLFKILLLSSINSSFGGASSAYVVPLLGLFFTGEFLFQNSSILS
jgi:hypothetical protein